MNKLTILICIASVNLIQGCTLLGLATDVALHSRVDELNQGRDSADPLYVEASYFTKKGLEQDIKIVSELIQEVSQAQQASIKTSQPEPRQFSVNYVNKEVCKQADSEIAQCYDAEYYQQFYIKQDAEHATPASASDIQRSEKQ